MYMLMVSGRVFATSSTVPLQLVFVPLAEVNVHRIPVSVNGACGSGPGGAHELTGTQ